MSAFNAEQARLLAADEEADGGNGLLGLWRTRHWEAVELLGTKSGAASPVEYARLLPAMNKKANGLREGGSKRRKDPIDPPAPPLVKQWRKLDRQSPCWMLAFAVPSARALAAAARHGPIVEQRGRSAPLAVPELGSCASSGRAWRLWAARNIPRGNPGHRVPIHRLVCSS